MKIAILAKSGDRRCPDPCEGCTPQMKGAAYLVLTGLNSMCGLLCKFKTKTTFLDPAKGDGLQGALDMGIKVLGNKGSPPPPKRPHGKTPAKKLKDLPCVLLTLLGVAETPLTKQAFRLHETRAQEKRERTKVEDLPCIVFTPVLGPDLFKT